MRCVQRQRHVSTSHAVNHTLGTPLPVPAHLCRFFPPRGCHLSRFGGQVLELARGHHFQRWSNGPHPDTPRNFRHLRNPGLTHLGWRPGIRLAHNQNISHKLGRPPPHVIGIPPPCQLPGRGGCKVDETADRQQHRPQWRTLRCISQGTTPVLERTRSGDQDVTSNMPLRQTRP